MLTKWAWEDLNFRPHAYQACEWGTVSGESRLPKPFRRRIPPPFWPIPPHLAALRRTNGAHGLDAKAPPRFAHATAPRPVGSGRHYHVIPTALGGLTDILPGRSASGHHMRFRPLLLARHLCCMVLRVSVLKAQTSRRKRVRAGQLSVLRHMRGGQPTLGMPDSYRVE